jgi:hypothetical protein
MNPRSFLIIFFLTLAVVGVPKATFAGVEISDTVTVEGEVPSQGYYLTFEVVARGQTGEDVIKALSAVDNVVKNYFPDYRGGYFSIKPLWEGESSNSTGEAFQGSVTYTVKILGVRTQEVLFEKLNALTKKYPTLHYRILATKDAVDPALRKRIYTLLRFNILQEAQRRGKLYGEKLNLKCKLRRVNFGKVKPRKVEPGENPRVSLSASVTYMCY